MRIVGAPNMRCAFVTQPTRARSSNPHCRPLTQPAEMRSVRPRHASQAALTLALLGLFGCRAALLAPPVELLEGLARGAEATEDAAPFERRTAFVTLDSEGFSGVFEALWIVRGGDDPAVRLQLLPEIGGVVLDVAATGAGFQGILPQAEIELAHTVGAGAAPRHLLAFLAVSLLENAVAPDPGRVEGVRAAGPRGDGPRSQARWHAQMEPRMPGAEVIAHLDADAALVGRSYRWRGVRWYEEGSEGEQRFVGGGFEWRVEPTGVEAIDARPDALFELALASAAGGPRNANAPEREQAP